MRDIGYEGNAQESQAPGIGVLEFGRSLRFAEVNGAKVTAAVDLPESVLIALASLVDVISREFRAADDRQHQADADRPRPMCRWHLGQYADYCSGCAADRLAGEGA